MQNVPPSRRTADPVMPDTSNVPHVGIVWGLRDGTGPRRLLHAGVPLSEAEVYGACLTYPHGHFAIWEGWQRLPPAALRRCGIPLEVREHEYDTVPRGRIVYEVGDQRFILYADRKLQAPGLVGQIAGVFGLEGARLVVRSDAHYRTPSGA